MRYFLISICCLLVGCTTYPKKNSFQEVKKDTASIVNPYFSDHNKDYVFKAKNNVYDKSFGGIFIVKKIAPNNHRVVFTTEMGSKIFDFSFHKNDFKVNFILDEINKKILINILEKDFRVLVRENERVISKSIKKDLELLEAEIVKKKYYYSYKKGVLKSIIRSNNGKEKVIFHFSNDSDVSTRNIQILHKNIKLKINLKSI